MQLATILALAGLAAAAPSATQVPKLPKLPLVPKPHHGLNTTIVHPDTSHNNTLKSMNPDHIVHSSNLYEYFKNNEGANHTIYINDTRKFINLGNVKPPVSKRDKRDRPVLCYSYDNNWAEQVQHWWGAWRPCSSCLYTSNDPLSASETLSWSSSLSIDENAGVSWNIIKDILSLSAGISVTETWSKSGSYTCNIPGNSVGQMAVQNYLVWGWMWSEGCTKCNDGSNSCGGLSGHDPRADGGAQAPVNSDSAGWGVAYSCNTGGSVQC